MHDVAILYDVVFAFDGYLAGLAALGLGSESDVVVILDDLGTDEAALKVRVDNACCLRCFHTLAECPRAALFGSGGEESLEVEQVVSGLDETVYSTLLETQVF